MEEEEEERRILKGYVRVPRVSPKEDSELWADNDKFKEASLAPYAKL
jgi:hypothetical protein